jgi:sodium-dependent dicarboxylate transporter 2/3/5
MATKRNLKPIIGLILGALFFSLPFIFAPESLSLAGQINLAIFLLAATLWVMEPIPIYATSVVVILLLIIGLSQQGPLAQWTQPSEASVSAVEGAWQIPAKAVDDDGKVWLQSNNKWRAESVELIDESATSAFVRVRSDALSEGATIAARGNNWQLSFTPPSYTNYLNTLASPIIILFLGGFVLAAGAVRYKLDTNLCRFMLRPFGTRPAYIILGLMVVTALLSGFMSNTATTAMMVAVILPIIHCTPDQDRFRIALALSIPFAANIGGILTPIGTPPNAIALGALASRDIAIPFTSWMLFTAPVVIILLGATWLLLMRMYPCSVDKLPLELKGQFQRNRKAISLYVIFGATVLLWVTESLHGLPSAMIAFMPVALLPAFGVIGKEDIRSLPWEVLWLMAGGIALGYAMNQTGLALWFVELVPWANLGAFGILAAFGVVAILLATFIANTVAATLLIPIVMSLVGSGVVEGIALQTAALTVALGASMGMSLPISTPPNAIAMSTGLLQTGHMIRAGVVVGLIGYGLLLASAFLFWTRVF